MTEEGLKHKPEDCPYKETCIKHSYDPPYCVDCITELEGLKQRIEKARDLGEGKYIRFALNYALTELKKTYEKIENHELREWDLDCCPRCGCKDLEMAKLPNSPLDFKCPMCKEIFTDADRIEVVSKKQVLKSLDSEEGKG